MSFILFLILVFVPILGISATAAPETLQAYTEESIHEEITQEATREREQAVAEDPLNQRQSEKTDNPALHEIMPDRYNFYGSLRLRYR